MSNKEKFAVQQADDMHLLRSFMQFLNDYIPIPQNLEESYGNYAMNIDSVIDRLKSTTVYTEQDRWISVNKKPNERDTVLLYCKGGRMVTGIFKPHEWSKECFYAYNPFNEDLERVEFPEYWMPLPSPPTVI